MRFGFSVTAFQQVGLRGSHCAQQVIVQDKMRIKILPALSDNYMYLVRDNFNLPSIRFTKRIIENKIYVYVD